MHGEIVARESGVRTDGSRIYTVNGLDFVLGYATSTNNNCLIDSLRQVLYDQAGILCDVDMQYIRELLREKHPAGVTQVRVHRPNFLDLEHHAFDTIDLLATASATQGIHPNSREFSIICLHATDADALHAARVGHGQRRLYLFNEGDRHFRPLLHLR